MVSHHTVCVGGPDASGECFVKNRVTRNLHVSDCVRVTYTLGDSAAVATAARIDRLEAASHTADCPRQ